MMRATFGYMIGFLLIVTIKKHIKDYMEKHPDSYEIIDSAPFVDDLLHV